MASAGEDGGAKPLPASAMVSFPRRLPHHQPIKLEMDEESAENTSPSNMWQVYALGGVMVMRWIWARWKERNDGGRREDPSG